MQNIDEDELFTHISAINLDPKSKPIERFLQLFGSR